MEVVLKNEGGLSVNNTGVSIAAKMTKTKAETIEMMIMKELCRESLTDLLDYWEVSLSELEQFMERAKTDLE